MPHETAQELIETFQLSAHPEGGHYRQTYRAQTTVETPRGPRPASTAILFMLRAGERSHWHRIASDELWYFHQGAAFEIWEIDEAGRLQRRLLSAQSPQHSVPAGRWFASRLVGEDGFGLVSCGVAPGFDFADFELAPSIEALGLAPLSDPSLQDEVRKFLASSAGK